MKRLKIAGWVFLVLVVLIVIAGFGIVQMLKPSYDGVVDTPGLKAEVTVYYDNYGIPHIYAKNELDAFRTLGYVHAQDRLWQMELLRRIARGRLSEVFGRDLVETDKFMLSLGIDEATKKTLATLDYDSQMVQEAQAYLDGINLFVEEGPTPIEFHLTSLEKQPFTLEDVFNTIGYMSFSFALTGLAITLNGAFTGVGRTMHSMIISMAGLWIGRIPVAYFLSKTEWGLSGV